ncbi:MAG: twin-arginine translocase TatA/TatE family subunit [Bacteroidota bacterium]|nr:twin-arginine translocase TatA/TatE family subunit [Bacteroidota bacterium]
MTVLTLLFLGGIGATEAILIFCAIVFLFGAKKIPELARGLGKGIREFKDATKEIKDNIEEGIKTSDTNQTSNQPAKQA